MINTIIVDDEIWVIKLIKSLVDWEKLGYSIVGEADNAVDAMELVRKKQPQVMITDIRMPGNDGLTLIRDAKELSPATKFIIISGYGEFDYAKAAIDFGVFSYLLKPLDKRELEHSLIKLRSAINNQDEQQYELLEEYRQNLESSKRAAFLRILTGQMPAFESEESVNSEFNSAFIGGIYRVVIYEPILPIGISRVESQGDEDILAQIFDLADAEYAQLCRETVKIVVDGRIAVVLNYTADNAEQVQESISRTDSQLSVLQAFSSGNVLISGVGCAVHGIHELPEAYATAITALRSHIYEKNDKQITYVSGYTKRTPTDIMPVELEKRLHRTSEICDTEEIGALIERILIPDDPLHPDDLYCALGLVADTMFQAWRQHQSLMLANGISREKTDDELRRCMSIKDMVEVLMKLANEVKQITVDSPKSQQEVIVSQVKAFIHKHYSEKLTLDMICEAVYFTPQYTCTVFKQNEGTTIVEYLTDYRINVARELLLNKKYRTNDVMKLVGYQDAKYFVKVFKKKVGVTPSEYRKMFM